MYGNISARIHTYTHKHLCKRLCIWLEFFIAWFWFDGFYPSGVSAAAYNGMLFFMRLYLYVNPPLFWVFEHMHSAFSYAEWRKGFQLCSLSIWWQVKRQQRFHWHITVCVWKWFWFEQKTTTDIRQECVRSMAVF